VPGMRTKMHEMLCSAASKRNKPKRRVLRRPRSGGPRCADEASLYRRYFSPVYPWRKI